MAWNCELYAIIRDMRWCTVWAFLLVVIVLGSGIPAFGQRVVGGQQPEAGEPLQGPPSDDDQRESPAVAERVLSRLRTAILAEDPNAVLACFDSSMPDYPSFSSTVRSLFTRFTAFRVRYHVRQEMEGRAKTAVVEFTMEATPANGTQPAVQRTQQLRFTFTAASQPGRIVEIEPSDFFSSF